MVHPAILAGSLVLELSPQWVVCVKPFFFTSTFKPHNVIQYLYSTLSRMLLRSFIVSSIASHSGIIFQRTKCILCTCQLHPANRVHWLVCCFALEQTILSRKSLLVELMQFALSSSRSFAISDVPSVNPSRSPDEFGNELLSTRPASPLIDDLSFHHDGTIPTSNLPVAPLNLLEQL